MKDNIALLADYKAEKTIVIGSPEERTGMEDFPEFKEWKAQYVEEYLDTHMVMDPDEADELTDLLIKEADAELELMEMKGDAEEDEDDDDESVVAVVKPKKVVKARKAVVKKKTAQKANKTASVPKKTAKLRKSSKTADAQVIFNKMFGNKPRKDVIAKFVEQVGLTAAGASTYYAKFKKAAEA